jgi:hypothetical protein
MQNEAGLDRLWLAQLGTQAIASDVCEQMNGPESGGHGRIEKYD